MLPDWFDLHALRLTVAAGVVVLGVGAVLALAMARQWFVKIVLAVVLIAGAVALVAYDRGPLHRCTQQTTCHFLNDDIAVNGAAAHTR
jgi:hypothetical protein